MRCPSCDRTLAALKAGDVEVDACQEGCGGVWFDKDELEKFDESHEFATHALLDLAKRKESVRVDHRKIKNCPRCQGEVLVRQFFDVKNEVEIDQCWICSGIWLDPGEINAIRTQYATAQDRAKAVNGYVAATVSDTKASLRADLKSQIAEYEEKTSNHFKAGMYAFKKLLGLEDPDQL